MEVQDQGAGMVALCWETSSWSIAVTFLLCPQMVEDATDLCGVSYKSAKSIQQGSTRNPITSQRRHLLTSSPLGIRIQCRNLQGHNYSNHSSVFPSSALPLLTGILKAPVLVLLSWWYINSLVISPKPGFHHFLLTLKNISSPWILFWDPDSTVYWIIYMYVFFFSSIPLVPQNYQVPTWTNYLYSQRFFCVSHWRKWYHWTTKNGTVM